MNFPTGPGTPFDQYQQAFEEATAACRGIRSFTAELRLSGRAGSERLRGRLLAGLEQPASIRLEGLAPFGPPVFILVGRADRATLLLPKDDLVVRDERPADLLNALAGLELGPDELRVVLTGCATRAPAARAGRAYDGGWAGVEADSTILYLKQVDGRWRTLGAEVGGAGRAGGGTWRVEYGDWLNGIPRRIRISSGQVGRVGQVEIDLTVEVVELQANVTLDARAFDLDVPATAQPLTLEELRRIGPLGAARAEKR